MTPNGMACVSPRQARAASSAFTKAPKSSFDPAIYAKVTLHAAATGVPADIVRQVVPHESDYKPRVRGRAENCG